MPLLDNEGRARNSRAARKPVTPRLGQAPPRSPKRSSRKGVRLRRSRHLPRHSDNFPDAHAAVAVIERLSRHRPVKRATSAPKS